MKSWNKNTHINIIDSIRKLIVYVKKIFPKNTLKIITTLLLLILAAIFYINYFNKPNTSNTSTNSTSDQIKLDKVDQSKIGFNTITPDGKPIQSLGGWTRINPPSANYLVVAYADKIGSINIKVSQQVLPEDLVDDTHSKIQDIALGYGASQKISSGDDTIFIGTASNQVQSLIFARNGILVLIKSDGLISNNSWLQYIDTLK